MTTPRTSRARRPAWRRVLVALLVLPTLLALATAAAAQQTAVPAADPLAGVDLPAVVAQVGDVAVTREELLTQARLLRAQALRATGEDPARQEAFLPTVLEGLVEEALLYVDSRRRGTAASDAEVDAKIAEMEAGLGSAEALDAALAAQGSDRATLAAQLRQTLSVEKALAEAMTTAEVGEAEKRAFYEEHRDELMQPERFKVRHILVMRESEAEPGKVWMEGRVRAEEAMARVRAGEDFATVAAEVSDDAESRERGGEMPWLTLSGKPNPLEDAVQAMQAGDMRVVESPAGFHVLELVERRPAAPVPFAEVEERIEQALRDRSRQRAVRERIERLRGETTIETFL